MDIISPQKKYVNHSGKSFWKIRYLMVVMMVMMMMVRVMTVRLCAYVALGLGARLSDSFDLNGRVLYAVLSQLLADARLDACGILGCHNVHRGVISHTVNAPYVYMVNIFYTLNIRYLISYICY